MGPSDANKVSLLDFIFWKLAICNESQASLKVLEFFSNDLQGNPERDPRIRWQEILDRSEMGQTLSQEKLMRPSNTFNAFEQAHFYTRSAGISEYV
jgi:hypothetical protein